jgi:hypothetical protein
MSTAVKPLERTAPKPVDLEPTSVRDYLERALQIVVLPEAAEDIETSLAGIAHHLTAAIRAVEKLEAKHEAQLAEFIPADIKIEIDWAGGPFTVVGCYRKVAGQSLVYADMIVLARRLKEELKASNIQPYLTIQSRRPTVAPRGD